jgi:hypothetical protein
MTSPERAHRVGDLMGMAVVLGSGRTAGKVGDVRVVAPAGTLGYGGLVIEGLVVSHRSAGSMLGYDRRREQGPWLVRKIVQRLHRHAGYVSWTSVEEVEWSTGRVKLRVDELERLEEA